MGHAMWRPGVGGHERAAEGLPAGVRSAMFQGMTWQTISARLGTAAMHAHVRARAPWPYNMLWVGRTAAQNDVESCFGTTTDGSASKDTPMLLGPRLDEFDVMDQIRHDPLRAAVWHAPRSRRSAYDAVDPMAGAQQVVGWGCGDGDARTSDRAEKWEYYQRQRAIAAAAGKQETVRTNNTITSRNVRAGAREGRRQRLGS